MKDALKGFGAFLLTRVGMAIVWMLAAATAVYFKDQIPFLAKTCEAYQPCNIRMADLQGNISSVSIAPVPVTEAQVAAKVVDKAVEVAKPNDGSVAVPFLVSASTESPAPAAQ